MVLLGAGYGLRGCLLRGRGRGGCVDLFAASDLGEEFVGPGMFGFQLLVQGIDALELGGEFEGGGGGEGESDGAHLEEVFQGGELDGVVVLLNLYEWCVKGRR